jgi:hypothetical protein
MAMQERLSQLLNIEERKMNYILGGCQIDAPGLESAGSFNLISKVITTKLIKEILKNEGKESVWQL